MAMEDLLRIAQRTEDLPDQTLAQIAAADSGIESVIAASEMKARNDLRQEAQAMQSQAQPPVVQQLINMAMRQPAPPMGAVMPPQMQQPMPSQMPPQAAMPQPMPQDMQQPMPPQMAPDVNQLAQQLGIPAMNVGGLIRRFQSGSRGTIGNLQQFYMDQLGYDPRGDFSNVYVPGGFDLSNLYEIEQGILKNQEEIDPEFAAQIEAAVQEADKGIRDKNIARTYGRAFATGDPLAPTSGPISALSGILRQFIPSTAEPYGAEETAFLAEERQAALEAARQKAVDKARADKQRQLLSQLPQGSIQQLMTVGGDKVSAFVPSGSKTLTLPSSFALYTPPAPKKTIDQLQQLPVLQSGTQDATDPDTTAPVSQNNQTSGVMVNQRGGTTIGPDANTATTLAFQPYRLDAPKVGVPTPSDFNAPMQSIVGQEQDNKIFDSIEVKQRELEAERLAQLVAREKELADSVTQRQQKLEELEGELPTRENIKDRIKEQTRLGMATAFFNAAGTGSPDFLTALSRGFAGATDVMGKMTGQEQKELYQFAMDNYNRESQKANRDYVRRQDLTKQINDVKSAQITRRANQRTNDLQLRKMQNENYWKAQQINLDRQRLAFEAGDKNAQRYFESQKLSQEALEQFRSDLITVNRNRQDALDNVVNIPELQRAAPDQYELFIDIDNNFAAMFNLGAQINENKGIRRISKRLVEEYQDLDPALSEAERRGTALSNLVEKLDEEEKIGDLKLLEKYRRDLFDLNVGDAEQRENSLKAFYQKYPYLDPKNLLYSVQR